MFLTFTMASPVALSQNEFKLESENQKISYAIGYQIGQSILIQLQEMPDLDLDVLSEAVSASLLGAAPSMSEQAMSEALVSRQQQIHEERARQSEENAANAMAFLEKNKTREGVVVTESGIQYQILKSGDSSGVSPESEDAVLVHYEGKLVDGTIFDSSRARQAPARFSLTGVIPGWSEVLQLMRPGDVWSVVFPPEMAYGESGAGSAIGPNQVLLFEIELIEVLKSPNA